MLILGIETSCDETAASVVADGKRILSNVIATSMAEHAQFGGVVPEIACRHHVEWIQQTIEQSLKEAEAGLETVDAVAVTQGPGLPGALLVGISMAKALAFAFGKPLLGIHHLRAHLYANFLSGKEEAPALEFPYMGLIVSGGHTILALVRNVDDYTVIGQTVDDAAGEAFDKVAKLLGLGYPGGPIIDASAKKGNPDAVRFPRAMIHEKNFDFSFSGVKTAVMYYLQKAESGKWKMDDLCASFQEAVVDVLVEKSLRACREFGTQTLSVGGGVAANSRLREKLREKANAEGMRVLFPPKDLSIDNAAMVAGLGGALLQKGYHSDLTFTAQPNWNIEVGAGSPRPYRGCLS